MAPGEEEGSRPDLERNPTHLPLALEQGTGRTEGYQVVEGLVWDFILMGLFNALPHNPHKMCSPTLPQRTRAHS